MDGVATPSIAKTANYKNSSPLPSYEEKSAFLFAIPNNVIKHENSKWLKEWNRWGFNLARSRKMHIRHYIKPVRH